MILGKYSLNYFSMRRAEAPDRENRLTVGLLTLLPIVPGVLEGSRRTCGSSSSTLAGGGGMFRWNQQLNRQPVAAVSHAAVEPNRSVSGATPPTSS